MHEQRKKPEVKFEDLYDIDKIDDMVLALFSLTLDSDGRAWKGVDRLVTDRLYEKGLIYDPKNKAKSVGLTEEGIEEENSIGIAIIQVYRNTYSLIGACN